MQPDRIRLDLLQGFRLDCIKLSRIRFWVQFPDLANESKTFDRRHRGGLDDLHAADLRTTRERVVEHDGGVTAGYVLPA